MLQRITVLFALTGLGHVFSVAVLKFIAQHGLTSQLAGIGEAESLIQLIIGLIGFGMQSDAIRDIALNENWKEKYQQAQTARVTLSLFVILLSLLSFSNNIYLCFAIAPVLALSGDYALYGRGFPVVGSFVAFVRIVVPLLAGVASVLYWPEQLLMIYVIATIVAYIFTNSFISFFLKVKLIFFPRLRSILLYIKTLPLGVLNLCFYFFGLGILPLSQLFYQQEDLVVIFLALKLYVIYKGAMRVIHQAFIMQMNDDRVCLSIDQLSILFGLAFFGSTMIFPNTFISLFFGSQFAGNHLFFALISLSAMVFSFFNSSTTRQMLDHQEKRLMRIALLAVGTSIVFLFVVNQFSQRVEMTALSLLIGEFVFTCGVIISFYDVSETWARASFLLISSTILLVPFIFRMIFSDDLPTYFISFALMGLILLFLFYDKFKLPVSAEKTRTKIL